MKNNIDTTIKQEDGLEEIASGYLGKFGRKSLGRPPTVIAKQLEGVKKQKDKKQYFKKRKQALVVKNKFDLFMDEYEKNGGNGTEAAMKVYGYTNRTSAGSMAHVNLKQARNLGRLILEKQGVGYEHIIKILIKKAEESKDPAFWDRLFKLAGYEDIDFSGKSQKATVSVNINQTLKEDSSEFGFQDAIEGEVSEDQ